MRFWLMVFLPMAGALVGIPTALALGWDVALLAYWGELLVLGAFIGTLGLLAMIIEIRRKKQMSNPEFNRSALRLGCFAVWSVPLMIGGTAVICLLLKLGAP